MVRSSVVPEEFWVLLGFYYGSKTSRVLREMMKHDKTMCVRLTDLDTVTALGGYTLSCSVGELKQCKSNSLPF